VRRVRLVDVVVSTALAVVATLALGANPALVAPLAVAAVAPPLFGSILPSTGCRTGW